MTRNKVKLEFIVNETKRKATFKKRKNGLFKKTKEITILCEVEACAIIYSPYNKEPEVWPSRSGVSRVLNRFLKLSSKEQGKRKLDQVAYLEQRKKKVRQQLEKLRVNNKEKKITKMMYDFLGGESSLEGLDMLSSKNLCSEIDESIKLVDNKIKALQENKENN